MRFVVTHEIADQRFGHAELHVAVDMRVGGIVDLRNQNLESRLENQRMQMRRPMERPFSTRGEFSRQNGPSSDCAVSVLPWSPLFKRQTSGDTPSEPAINTTSLWVSFDSWPSSARMAQASRNSASVRRTSRTN